MGTHRIRTGAKPLHQLHCRHTLRFLRTCDRNRPGVIIDSLHAVVTRARKDAAPGRCRTSQRSGRWSFRLHYRPATSLRHNLPEPASRRGPGGKETGAGTITWVSGKVVDIHCQTDCLLPQVTSATGSIRGHFGAMQGRQQQRREISDNGDHHEEFDQCESAEGPVFFRAVHHADLTLKPGMASQNWQELALP